MIKIKDGMFYGLDVNIKVNGKGRKLSKEWIDEETLFEMLYKAKAHNKTKVVSWLKTIGIEWKEPKHEWFEAEQNISINKLGEVKTRNGIISSNHVYVNGSLKTISSLMAKTFFQCEKVKHIDGDTENNKIENLVPLNKHIGVFKRSNGSYVAKVGNKAIGTFLNEELAIECYKDVKADEYNIFKWNDELLVKNGYKWQLIVNKKVLFEDRSKKKVKEMKRKLFSL